MRFPFCVLLTAGMLWSASAAPLQSVELFTPGKNRVQILFHRRDNSQIRNISVTGKEILINRSDAPDAAYFDCQANPPQNVPEFTKANFRVKVFLPPKQPVRSFNLRLADADNEVFQFRAALPESDGEWHEIVFFVDAFQPKAESWGGGKKADGKLTMPVKFRGVTGDFGAAITGTIGIGRVVCDIIDSNAPIVPELLTGSGTPIHVLKIGEEQELALHLRNPRPRRMSGELKWSLTGVRSESLEEKTERICLETGEEKLLELPRPSVFGVYKLNIELIDDDSAVRTYRKEMRFAYLMPAGPTPERDDVFVFGVCSHTQRHGIDEQRKEAMAAGWCGAKALREDIEWFRVQPAEGRWEFDSFDRVIEIFGEYGVEVMPIFAYGTGWAKAKDWKPLKPEFFHRERPDYDAWRKFVGTFAARYRDKVHYAEIWNEPDLYMFANFPETEYVRMLGIAYDELKRVAPEWQVLCGGFACLPGQSGKAGNPATMPAVIRSGKYDVFAFHGHGPFGGYRNQIERLPSYGNRKPWFANETAISSMVHGEEVQAQTLFRKLIYSWAKGAVGYNWYDLRNDGFEPANNEHNFGMLTKDFYPKPVYAAYNALSSLYRGGEFLHEVQLGKNLHGYWFRGRDGELLLAAWSDSEDEQILPLVVAGITGKAETVDLYGNAKTLPVENGFAIFEIGSEPSTLRVTEQTNEIKVADALIRPLGELEIAPGGEAAFEFELYNPERNARNYSVRFALPSGISSDIKTEDIRLAPGEKRKISIPVRAETGFQSLPGKQKTLTIFLDSRSFRYRINSVTRIPAEGYHAEPDFILDTAGQVHALFPNSPETAHLFWKGIQDLSAKVWLGRDSDSLLLKTEVTDDKHVQSYSGEEVWKGDNIQFALLLPNQKGNWEIGLTRLESGNSEVHVWHAPQTFKPEAVAAKIELSTSRDDKAGITNYEARIPFAAIGLTETTGHAGFCFNLLVNDNDGFGRESFIAIAPGLGESKDSSHWLIVKLH